jgi:hypothetical protein
MSLGKVQAAFDPFKPERHPVYAAAKPRTSLRQPDKFTFDTGKSECNSRDALLQVPDIFAEPVQFLVDATKEAQNEETLRFIHYSRQARSVLTPLAIPRVTMRCRRTL